MASAWITSTRPGTSRSQFSRAREAAVSLISTATTRAPGTSLATQAAIAPEPVHRSAVRTTPPPPSMTARAASMAAPATTSVSGRTMNTPGRLMSSAPRSHMRPMMCWRGSRHSRRSTSAS